MAMKASAEIPQLPFAGIIREGRVLIGPDLAERILCETNYEGQRKIAQSQVETYAEMMERGIWLPGGQIAFGRLNGALHLVNGQHRLAAVKASGKAQEFQILIVNAANAAALRELYWRFDAVMRQRSTQQILAASGVANAEAVSKGMASAVYQAISFITNDMRTPAGGHRAPAQMRIIDARMEACTPWWDEARLYDQVLGGASGTLKRKLMVGSVVAVALVTLKHQREKAKEFWSTLAANDGLRKGDPRHTLVNFLLTTHDKGSGEQHMAACAAAWNAFLGRRSLIAIRPTSPVKINGTPFDGKHHRRAA